MITEIVQIDVKPGMESEYEAASKMGLPLFQRAKGCRSMVLMRSIEKPSRFRVLMNWDTVENHTVDFRGTPDHREWRRLIDRCLDRVEIEHMTQVLKGF